VKDKEDQGMDKKECSSRCAFERAAEVEFRALSESVRELKERMGRLEATLSRGTTILIANLAGMVITLARQLIG
jgi:hypothetical protein